MQASKSSAGQARPSSKPGQMMKIYTDDSPGIIIDPVVVLVGALTFIASVFILHLGNLTLLINSWKIFEINSIKKDSSISALYLLDMSLHVQ
jgi:hypothetical protein